MIVVRAPLRVSLLGGGCDFSSHFLNHGGAILSMAVNRYVYFIVVRS